MFESYSPEQRFPQEPIRERSDSELPRTRLQHEGPNQTDDEMTILRQIEERAKQFPQELSFLSLERSLDLALSNDALDAYKRAGYLLKKDSELYFFRLTDLGTALTLLDGFKDQLPHRYQANIGKVLDHADAIRKMFHEYRLLRKQGEGRDDSDVIALVSALGVLRKIDSNQFPADLVDVTEEERQRAMAQPRMRVSG